MQSHSSASPSKQVCKFETHQRKWLIDWFWPIPPKLTWRKEGRSQPQPLHPSVPSMKKDSLKCSSLIRNGWSLYTRLLLIQPKSAKKSPLPTVTLRMVVLNRRARPSRHSMHHLKARLLERTPCRWHHLDTAERQGFSSSSLPPPHSLLWPLACWVLCELAWSRHLLFKAPVPTAHILTATIARHFRSLCVCWLLLALTRWNRHMPHSSFLTHTNANAFLPTTCVCTMKKHCLASTNLLPCNHSSGLVWHIPSVPAPTSLLAATHILQKICDFTSQMLVFSAWTL